MKICVNCNTQNSDENRFCEECGNKIVKEKQDNSKLTISLDSALTLTLSDQQKVFDYVASKSQNSYSYFKDLLDVYLFEISAEIFQVLEMTLLVQNNPWDNFSPDNHDLIKISSDIKSHEQLSKEQDTILKNVAKKMVNFILKRSTLSQIPNSPISNIADSIYDEFLLYNINKQDFSYAFPFFNKMEEFSSKDRHSFKNFLKARYNEKIRTLKSFYEIVSYEHILSALKGDHYKPIAKANTERLEEQERMKVLDNQKISMKKYLESNNINVKFETFLFEYKKLLREQNAWEKQNELSLINYKIEI